MHKHDAVGGIHVKRLTFFVAVGVALRGVAHLTHAAVTRQITHIAGSEHVAHQAHCLMHMEGQSVERSDTGSVLPAVLQKQQRVIEPLVDRLMRE